MKAIINVPCPLCGKQRNRPLCLKKDSEERLCRSCRNRELQSRRFINNHWFWWNRFSGDKTPSYKKRSEAMKNKPPGFKVGWVLCKERDGVISQYNGRPLPG